MASFGLISLSAPQSLHKSYTHVCTATGVGNLGVRLRTSGCRLLRLLLHQAGGVRLLGKYYGTLVVRKGQMALLESLLAVVEADPLFFFELDFLDKKEDAFLKHLASFADDTLLPFYDILSRAKAPDSQICGRVFEKGDLIYHCRDCTSDETCVLCSACFNRDFHGSHNYSYYLSKGSGGCCDCGEDEAWNNGVECLLHRATSPCVAQESPLLPDELSLNDSFAELFCFIEYVVQRSPDEPFPTVDESVCVVLYNDEVHTFQDVIDCLEVNLHLSQERSLKIAECIDHKGFASIFQSDSIAECRRVSAGFSAVGLEARVMPASFFVENQMCHYLFSLLAKCTDVVARIFFQSSDPQAVPSVSDFIRVLFENDYCLWKGIRGVIQVFLTKLSLISTDAKVVIANNLVDLFETMTQNYASEKREPHLTILNIMVQILTTPSVVRHVVCNKDGLAKILRYLARSIASHGIKRAQKVQKICFQALDFLVSDKGIHDSAMLEGHLLHVLDLINTVGEIGIVDRCQHEHVLYERDDWISDFNFSLALSRFLHSFCSAARAKAVPLFRLLLANVKTSDGSPTDSFESLHQSWYQPLVWLFAYLARHLPAASSHPALPEGLLSRALRTHLLYAQVKSGLWVRNGTSMSSQAILFACPEFRHYFEAPVLFSIQFYSRHVSRDRFADIFFSSLYLDSLCSTNSLEPAVLLSMLKEVTSLACFVLADDFGMADTDEAHLCVAYHFLCTGPATFFRLLGKLPYPYSNPDRIQQILPRISECQQSQSAPLLYIVDPGKCKDLCYSPFFSLYSDSDRLASLDYMKKSHSFDWAEFVRRHAKQAFFSSPAFLESKRFDGFLLHCLKACLDFSAHVVLLQNTLFLVLASLSGQPQTSAFAGKAFELLHGLLGIDLYSQEKEFIKGILAAFDKQFMQGILPLSPAPDLALARRKKAELFFKGQQKLFNTNSEADSQPFRHSPDAERCLLCQEFLHLSSSNSGMLIGCQDSSLLGLLKIPTEACAYADGVYVSSCGHSMHLHCFESLPVFCVFQRRAARLCPLCRSFATGVMLATSEEGQHATLALESLSTTFGISTQEGLQESFLYTLFCTSLGYGLADFHRSYSFLAALFSFIRHLRKRFPPTAHRDFSTDSVRCLLAKILVSPLSEADLEACAHDASTCRQACILVSIFNKQPYPNLDDARAMLRFLGLATEAPLSSALAQERPPLVIPTAPCYDLVLNEYNQRVCPNCQRRPIQPALCMFCGSVVCARSSCCQDETGECNMHMKRYSPTDRLARCSPSIGAFLMLHKCLLLFLGDGFGYLGNAPYLTKHHEFDAGLKYRFFLACRSGMPLYHSESLRKKLLNDIVFHRFMNNFLAETHSMSYEMNWREY